MIPGNGCEIAVIARATSSNSVASFKRPGWSNSSTMIAPLCLAPFWTSHKGFRKTDNRKKEPSPTFVPDGADGDSAPSMRIRRRRALRLMHLRQEEPPGMEVRE
jgi:hypothetical protein